LLADREISGTLDERAIESPAFIFHHPRMPFPSTPLTLLGRLKHGDTHLWETSWEEFFDLYHHAVNVCVLGAFTRYKWHDVPHQDLQDVAISVFESIFKGHESFDPAKGRFRSLLTTLCQRRVVDFIRAHMRKAAKTTHIDSEILEKMESDGADAKNSSAEEEAFRNALLGTLLSARRSLHAQSGFLKTSNSTESPRRKSPGSWASSGMSSTIRFSRP
jgi:DNA-directed RNA polymerase specialized sigma24 family protein